MAGWLKACYETQKAMLQGEISLVCIGPYSSHHEQVGGNSTYPQGTPICHGKDLGKKVLRGRNTHFFHPGSFSPVCDMEIIYLPAEELARQDLLLDGGIEVLD